MKKAVFLDRDGTINVYKGFLRDICILSKEDFYGSGKGMNKDIKKDLYELISELQGVKQNMNENDSLKKDLGLDSLMLVSLIVAIEERFHIEIKDSDLSAENLETVGNLCTMLEKYI